MKEKPIKQAKKTFNKRKLGTAWEQKAVDYLRQNGFVVIETNFRCKTGEIDIIARDRDYLVFIEVKYRANAMMGEPLEAVTYRKQMVIRRTALCYLVKNEFSMETPCRFDVVGILGNQITLTKDAF